MSLFRAGAAALLGLLLVTGCTADRQPVADPPPDSRVRTALPDAATTVVEGVGAVELAVATSRAIYVGSPAVVLVGEEDDDALSQAEEAATALGVPVLVTPAADEAGPAQPAPARGSGERPALLAPARGGAPQPAVTTDPDSTPGAPPPAASLLAEFERLGVRAVLTAGAAAANWAGAVTLPPGVVIASVDEPVPVQVDPPAPLSSLLVLAQGTPGDGAAVATARAAGAEVLVLGAADPRATSATVQAVAGAASSAGGEKPPSIGPVLALGSAFGPAERLRHRVTTAGTGVELPGGGQLLFPGRRMVALYGHPGDPGLGVLGEQPVAQAVVRAQQLAASYQAFTGEPVVPAFEIIVTVASGRTGSNTHPVEKFRPWVQAAREAGIYVVLDLQPGDVHFLEQARLYEELLREPHVGLALDPEWRVQPGKQHMVQIGSVDAAEINEVGQWLAQLTRDHNLPQKVLMLHQFRLDMISNRPAVVTDYDELRVVIHADGFGSPGAKHGTWNTLHVDAPAVAWGWKNFYDEDTPTFTPQQTMAVSPDIVFVSYQ